MLEFFDRFENFLGPRARAQRGLGKLHRDLHQNHVLHEDPFLKLLSVLQPLARVLLVLTQLRGVKRQVGGSWLLFGSHAAKSGTRQLPVKTPESTCGD